ncbi:uracil-DNA glycosylase [Allomyces macrogynus ATCC 38327]|uniref:Uracil-DNA glycosylase n=1 Tax=Allomyces macrogynus (strain ATCC 38327) TaxID=578462 RepID=A0A0L0T3Z7_ALLM3|nr:uracil-DNA glycosylase [Allomyces macrogynus ATCC 38327]|eukprot:KNE69523.1 uracil-DNA glycosylase [Allomyces macrogynus ATCC 38327]
MSMQAWLKKANPNLDLDKGKSPAASTTTKVAGTKRPNPATNGESSSTSTALAPRAKKAKVYPASNPKDGPEHLALERAAMHPSWYYRLEDELKKPYMKELKTFLAGEEARGKIIYPPSNMVYTWATIPFDQIKVVILGQDPYHNPGQAHGLSFSVLPGIAPPPSLVNIYTELVADHDQPKSAVPQHGYLGGWAKQGVLLLNAVLTVNRNEPASHAKKGWEKLTDAVVKHLNAEGDHLVFILWGSHAQKKGAGIDKKRHLVLTSAHPSPLSAYRGFFGSKPFSKANAYLEKNGKTPIDWMRLPTLDEEKAEEEAKEEGEDEEEGEGEEGEDGKAVEGTAAVAADGDDDEAADEDQEDE